MPALSFRMQFYYFLARGVSRGGYFENYDNDISWTFLFVQTARGFYSQA